MKTRAIRERVAGSGKPTNDAREGAALLGRVLCLAVVVLACALPGSVSARMTEEPRSFSLPDKSLEDVDRRTMKPIDREKLMAEDRGRRKNPERPGPERFAVSEEAGFDLRNSGTWLALPDGRLWRLRIHSPGAVSNNLGINRFDLPKGAKLWIYDPEGEHVEGSYTSRHRNHEGGLWTPIIQGDEIVVELFVPAEASHATLRIAQVNKGYHGFGHSHGACNNDVICPEGDPWRDQIRSVAMYIRSGIYYCSGQLMNNTALEFKPYFLSANHCGVSATNDHTMVFFWNYEAANCGDQDANLTLADTQTGSTFRASSAPSDFVLVELDVAPAATNAYFSGWDRTTGTAPASTVAIHHPSGHVKSISFNTNPVTSTAYLSNAVNATANHWRVDDWEDGTTEGGSSGSCLWNAANHLCVGQLHGGYASCAAPTTSDWYGKLSVSWTGGGSSATRLSDWLDPVPTGALTLHGDPHITTLDGTHYDFQGAGEYVVLRDPDVAEIQVRQAPIATTFNPGPNPYHGLATCVSLNTAVAARVGKRRVTYQPDLSGVPNPDGLQLRIDGDLMTLGPNGIDLGNGGRIVQTTAPGGLEVVFPAKYILRVTPGWWASQSKWYLNADVIPAPSSAVSGASLSDARFIGGIAGPIAPRSWLPALPDGSSMGPMPAALHDRYVDLYEKFGEAWRVTDATSLFDYASGRSTATFTLKTWPMEQPPCELPDVKPVKPVSLEVAQEACAKVQHRNMRADCVFDVRVTGELGFATTYLLTENATTISALDEQPHFECYRVDKPTRQSEKLVVRLEDQFDFVKTRLGQITKICTPVSKNGEGIPDKELHLVCYEILNPHDPRQPVLTTNQFGKAKMYVRESQELCVPSTKKKLDLK